MYEGGAAGRFGRYSLPRNTKMVAFKNCATAVA
ncbi:hypothetical protein [Klebsiella phage Kpn74]|nr:hypothetical protein [Klebsiella phage Kpn74]